jgi:hypothetical protein
MADDPNVRKKKPPRIWHAQHEKILKEWGESSSCYRHMHFKAYQINKGWSMSFTLPVIIISTITGTANFAQKTFPESVSEYIPSIIGAFNLFAAIMTTVAQFLKVTELMENHRVTSIQYGKLARKIRLELTLPISERTQHGDNMVEMCRSEYDRLIEQSPPVPKKVIKLFDKSFPDTSNVVFKPELSIVRPIDLFDNEKEEERIRARAEKEEERAREKRKKDKFSPSQLTVMNDMQTLANRAVVSRRVQYDIPTRAVRLIEGSEIEPDSPVRVQITEENA